MIAAVLRLVKNLMSAEGNGVGTASDVVDIRQVQQVLPDLLCTDTATTAPALFHPSETIQQHQLPTLR